VRCPACDASALGARHKLLAALRAQVRCPACGAGLRFGWGAHGAIAVVELVAGGTGAWLAIRYQQPALLLVAFASGLLVSLPLAIDVDGRDAIAARRQRFPERRRPPERRP